jgi:hypothetical protein
MDISVQFQAVIALLPINIEKETERGTQWVGMLLKGDHFVPQPEIEKSKDTLKSLLMHRTQKLILVWTNIKVLLHVLNVDSICNDGGCYARLQIRQSGYKHILCQNVVSTESLLLFILS